MNFLNFQAKLKIGTTKIRLGNQTVNVPELYQETSGDTVFGVRPEHVRFTDNTGYRGIVTATEYLGTNQLVTLDTANGEIKARISSNQKANVGETVGLGFESQKICTFRWQVCSGHSALNNNGAYG